MTDRVRGLQVRIGPEQATRTRHPLAGSAVALVLGFGVMAWAGYVFDGAGIAFEFGVWAATWGAGVGLLGITVVAMTQRWRVARMLAGLLAITSALVGGGVLLRFTGPFELPFTSLEGLWMYPLTVLLLLIAGLAGRRALTA